MTHPLFVSCAEHLESLLLTELTALEIREIKPARRGVYIPNTLENIFKVNYLSRLSTRALLPLAQFFCPDQNALYAQAKKIDWTPFFKPSTTLAIDANVSHPNIRHSLYAAQVVKDAICDQLREKTGERPSVDIKNPDVQLNLFITPKEAILSFDTSGAPLYRRGWKEVSTEATLPETLASALLSLSGYSARDRLCDPFCGAGTLLIEAACLATKTPAGFFRKKWGFFNLPHFCPTEWETFKNSWDQKRVSIAPQSIIGVDRDPEAIALCKKYVKKLGFEEQIVLIHSPIAKVSLPHSPTLVVTDPPFGKRMDTSKVIYQEFGQFLRSQCSATPFAFLICPSFSLVKATGYPVLSEKPVQHGGLRLTFFQLTL